MHDTQRWSSFSVLLPTCGSGFSNQKEKIKIRIWVWVWVWDESAMWDLADVHQCHSLTLISEQSTTLPEISSTQYSKIADLIAGSPGERGVCVLPRWFPYVLLFSSSLEGVHRNVSRNSMDYAALLPCKGCCIVPVLPFTCICNAQSWGFY